MSVDADPSPTPASALSLYFDMNDLGDAEVAEVLGELSDVYRSLGGDGLIIEGMTSLEPAMADDPQRS